MADERRTKIRFNITLPAASASELLGRQSVRATFKLTTRAIETLSVVSVQLGIKQKSLFDHLVDDIDTLEMIAKDIHPSSFQKLSRVQKTYVLSRKTLMSLEKASQIFDTPRDALVEYSIQRLRPIIAQERKKHEERKKIFLKMSEYLSTGERLLEEARTKLGEEDPVFLKLASAVSTCKSTHKNIELFVEKGRCMEAFE